LIAAHTGERVEITPAGRKRKDELDVDKMLAGIAEAAAGQGGDVNVTIPITLDGKKIAEFVTRASKDGRIRTHASAVRDW
jgi:hypothetical protein